MPTDIKLSKAQISKIIQSGGSFGSWLDSLDQKILTNVVIPLSRDNLPGSVSNITSNEKKNNKWTRGCTNRKKIYFIYVEWIHE